MRPKWAEQSSASICLGGQIKYIKNKTIMKTNLQKVKAGMAALALTAFGFGFQADANQTLIAPFSMPMQVNATVNSVGCNNSGGPEVTLDGEISLGGLRVKLIFKNNKKGTHTATVVTTRDVVLIPLGGSITIPKQPVRGGVGGNPFIYIQFHDGNGNDLTEEALLGRCVQGLSISPELLSEVIASTDLEISGCSNKGGPFINVGGTLTLSGLHARLIFRNNVKGTHTAEVTRDVTLVLEGSTITIPKQPVRGGAGGNPIICIQFLQGNGDPIGEPITLGRCNQL